MKKYEKIKKTKDDKFLTDDEIAVRDFYVNTWGADTDGETKRIVAPKKLPKDPTPDVEDN